jgi:hypothetical protein
VNYYWHTPLGKVVQVAINSSLAEAQDSPLSLEYGFIASEARHRPGDVYVAGGNLVEKPARPSPEHTWDYASQAWVDARTLDAVKAQRWAQIKAQRDAVEFGGFTWSGDEFDSDAESQARIMGAVQMALIAVQAEQPFAIDWTLASNAVRSMSAADIVSAGLALGEHVAAAHGIARTLRAAIDACTTAAEVEAVAWP